MLVLSRRVGEQIVIGEDIVITVVDTRNDTVRLGISAPRSVRVDRAELLRAVAESNQEAAKADDSALQSLLAIGRPPTQAAAPPRAAPPPASPAADRE